MDSDLSDYGSLDDTESCVGELNVADRDLQVTSLEVRCNTKTPDLDRVKKLLRGSNEGIRGLIDTCVEDTPLSQRKDVTDDSCYAGKSGLETQSVSGTVLVGSGSPLGFATAEIRSQSLQLTVPDDISVPTGSNDILNESDEWLRRDKSGLEASTQVINSPSDSILGTDPYIMSAVKDRGDIVGTATQIIVSPAVEANRTTAMGSDSRKVPAIHGEESRQEPKIFLHFSKKWGNTVSPSKVRNRRSPLSQCEEISGTRVLDRSINGDEEELNVYSDCSVSQDLSEMVETGTATQQNYKDSIAISTPPATAPNLVTNNVSESLYIESQDAAPPKNKRQLQVAAESYQDISDGLETTSSHDYDTRKKPKASEDQPIIYRDIRFLTKEHIKHSDSAWCYSSNFEYYPAKILDSYINRDVSLVLFRQGEYEVKDSDIHYLDIRVGEEVQLDQKDYYVEALENKEQHPINCIRGYDTVHLKPVLRNGRIGKRTIIRPLMDIKLSCEQWARRARIILDEGSQNRAKAFQYLKTPIRRSKGTNLLSDSPKRSLTASPIKTNRTDFYRSENISQHKAQSEDSVKNLELNLAAACNASPTKKVFSSCLFVITGIDGKYAEKITNIIESQGGTVISRFSDYLKRKNSQMVWTKTEFGSYKFACLVTETHKRTQRYLEALVLGWPTLHWKFIHRCIDNGGITLETSIFPFLLPAGESHRLSTNSIQKTGTIKSANISRFFMNLCQNITLKNQLDTFNVRQLIGFDVIIVGHSDTDEFVEFVFACFRANNLLKFNTTDEMSTALNQTNQNIDSGKLLIYVNYTDTTKSERAKSEISALLKEHKTRNHLYQVYVKTREWLIQTIISEDCGWS
ncbi:HHR204Wp [Eremothecium sinecaudum]|uniref:HHR204Wp n=1 Tax=Eremothecium sinecaudum TaxID=45286 RepID=A0A0X8HX31_9SACH|nr:HHR204Wp [Eremothecium sinecaudum]AMD22973.1 HHR204Wp [Eremothecium sinecaudum]